MQLAEINIARLNAPLESPEVKEFRDFIDPINQLAVDSPGFVWRLKGSSGESTTDLEETPWDYDPRIIVNLSVWKDLESLRNYAFTTVHSYFLRNRQKWFSKLGHPHLAMWWVEEGTQPDLTEAKRRLDLLESRGPTAAAFTFARPFPAPDDL